MAKVSVTYRDGRVKMVSERDAKVLITIGKASLTPEAPPKKSKPAATAPRTPSDDTEKSESKRAYRRRDLQAEE